jgi:hypothetical protein
MGMRQEGNRWRPRPVRAALLLGAAALPVAGLATGIVALPIAAAGCLAGAVALPRSARPDRPAIDPSSAAYGELDPEVAIAGLLEAVRGRVSPQVYEQVERICRLVEVGLQARRTDRSVAPDPDAFRLRQTVLSYLPGALDAYLAVPGVYASKSVRGRKSPHQVLQDELDLIEGSCRRLAEGAVAADADRLEAHGRYLEAALGHSRLDVAEPQPTAAQARSDDDPAQARERTRG